MADLVVALDCEIPDALRIHAKCDLDDEMLRRQQGNALRVSSKTGEGLELLRRAIAERVAALAAKGAEEIADVTARQLSLLEKARAALRGTDVADPVLAANALRTAAEAIGEILGKTYSSDLLDALFSRFCVGK